MSCFDQEQIICTAWLTAQHLKSINFKGKCYVVGMQSMAHELEKEGFEICGGIGVSRERYKEKNNYC